MSKFGVGVGDDFPVDDGSGNRANGDQAPRDDREEYEEWKRRRDAYRAQRDQWRRQREEWRARRRAFKEKVRNAARESFGNEWDGYRDGRRYRRGFSFWPLWALIPILAVVLFFSLIAAIFKSPFAFLALAVLGFFYFAHRHHERDRRYRDYDLDLKPANGPQPSASQTPPAGPQDGGK